jgi:hypothetical protein
MPTPQDRISRALDILVEEWAPFIRQEMSRVHGARADDLIAQQVRGDRHVAAARLVDPLTDPHVLLSLVWDQWNNCFRQKMGIFERSLVSELREYRNHLAHQSFLTEDDAFRVLDSVQRLLTATGQTKRLQEVEDEKFDALRQRFGHRVNRELARIRFNRRRVLDVTLYTLCCAALLITVVGFFWDKHALATILLAGFVMFTFAYFIHQRMTATVPVFGLHECPHCRRVIYTETCPYCEKGPARSSSQQIGNDEQALADAEFAHGTLEMIEHPTEFQETLPRQPR